jgi:hypothetical protein
MRGNSKVSNQPPKPSRTVSVLGGGATLPLFQLAFEFQVLLKHLDVKGPLVSFSAFWR